MSKIVVLNSGGFDSITLMNYLHTIQEEKEIYSLHFLYGANNEKQQLECVNKVCEKVGAVNKVIQLPPIDWTQSKFFNDGEYTASSQYLEYRNLIFLSYALSYAEAIGADKVYLALINNSQYPDTSLEFLQGLNYFCEPASGIYIDAPFIFDNKLRLGHIAKYLGIKNKVHESATRIWDMLTRIPELENKIVYASENRYLAWEYIGEALLKKNAWDHAFCPDCVVYGAKKMLYLSDDFSRSDIVSFMEKYGMPTLICYRRNIYIVAESVRKAQEIENVMSFSAQVQMANAEQGMNYLSDAQMEELLNWDSEKYRRLR